MNNACVGPAGARPRDGPSNGERSEPPLSAIFSTKSINYSIILVLSCIKCCIKKPCKRAFLHLNFVIFRCFSRLNFLRSPEGRFAVPTCSIWTITKKVHHLCHRSILYVPCSMIIWEAMYLLLWTRLIYLFHILSLLARSMCLPPVFYLRIMIFPFLTIPPSFNIYE